MTMRRSYLLLVLAVTLALGGAALAGRLKLDSRLEALLPSDSASVRSLESLRERLGIDEPLTILVESDTPEQSEHIVEALATALRRWDETQWVMTEYGVEALIDRALFYVEHETLLEWNELAEEAMDWEVCKASPFCVTIADPPELPSSDEVREAIERSPAGTALKALTGVASRETSPDSATPEGQRLCDESGRICAVQAMMKGSAGDLGYAQHIKAKAEALIAEMNPSGSTNARVVVSGRYRNAPLEHEITSADLSRVSLIAFAGLMLVVLAFFRDLRALLQLAVPVLSGLAASLGLIALMQPRINLISAAALAILAGMGIDFGIHLLMHFRAARADGTQTRTAAWESVRRLWVSLLVAGLTTACGFAALAISDFQGFSQMGWMASLGIVVCLLWTLACFPGLMQLIPGGLGRRFEARAAKNGARRHWALAALLLACLSVPLALPVEFERDFQSLRPASISHGIDSASVMRARKGVSVYVLGDDQSSVDAALDAEKLTESAGDALGLKPTIVSASALFTPDADAKASVIGSMRDTLERARKKAQEREDSKQLAELAEFEPWVAVEGKPEASQLPPWLASALVDAEGRVGHSGILYLQMRGSDAEAMEKLARWLEQQREEHPHVIFASAEPLLGEITPSLQRDAPFILALVFLGLILATALASRSYAITRDVVLATLLTGLLVLLALRLFELKLHLYNLLALPVVIGLAVDGAVHVRWARTHADPYHRYTAYRAVAASTLTSLVAFLSLLAAESPGLRSLGLLGALGLGISLLVNLLWLRDWCPVQTAVGTAESGQRPERDTGPPATGVQFSEMETFDSQGATG